MVDKRKIWLLLKTAFQEWLSDNAIRWGASISFYTVFSLPPLLMISVAMAGIFFGEEAVHGSIVRQFQDLLGEDSAQLIQDMILQTGSVKTNLIASLVGTVTLLIGATGVFIDLQEALNTIWEVERKPGSRIRDFIKKRALSMLLTLITGFLLLLSLIISTLLSALEAYIKLISPVPFMNGLLHAADSVVSLGIISFLFAVIFKILPDAKITWRDVWLGAVLTAFFFIVGKFAIGLYLGKKHIGSVFGAAGSLATLLFWIYLHAQIFLFGAEFTQVYAKMFGRKPEPEGYASHAENKRRVD